MTIESIIEDLINSDFAFSFIIFILLFCILYLGLTVSNFFKQKNLNLVVALIISVLAIVPHYLGIGFDIVEVIERFLPNLGVLIIIAIFTVMLAGLFGQDKDFFLKNGYMIFSLAFVIVLNVIIFYSLPGIFEQFLTVSLLLTIWSALGKGKGLAAFLPTAFALIFFVLFYWAIIDETTLPEWIMWIGDPFIYKTLIGVLAFAIIIRFVLRD
ncbi:hypothetical protein KY345_06030 [Candidatus Woesearchaeota archaeon]|nr:hypothetical protein [Candidatus Woesearchaeota archaeon]